MLRSGQILTGTIAYLDESSNGILMAGKDKVFVRHVLAKEKVKVKIQKRLKEGYSANVIEILQKDKERIKPVCGIYERCGSCHLMHMSAQGQKHQKLSYLQKFVQKTNSCTSRQRKLPQ